ncbi:MAG: endonuclease domain-containing protein [Caldilineaceae bacterium]|nr:endonuclease domain-containing protein [Caldilineaceae bacterium]
MPDGPFIAWTKFQPPPELWERLKPVARQMRREPTPAENRLWQRIRKRQVAGAKFRRQVPFERFLVDFCCFEVRLMIEVDGPIHQYSVEADAIRQEFLGFRVLRFTNQQVFLGIDGVVGQIGEAVRAGRGTPT